MAKKKGANPLPKLTQTEQDLLSHIQDGYEIETDSLGTVSYTYSPLATRFCGG
jgi:hypothetical protein